MWSPRWDSNPRPFDYESTEGRYLDFRQTGFPLLTASIPGLNARVCQACESMRSIASRAVFDAKVPRHDASACQNSRLVNPRPNRASASPQESTGSSGPDGYWSSPWLAVTRIRRRLSTSRRGIQRSSSSEYELLKPSTNIRVGLLS